MTAGAAPDPLLILAESGLDLLAEERAVFLSGRFAEVPQMVQRKAALLEQLEHAVQQGARSARALELVQRLIEESRRNEEIIRAARQGLAHARRRITSIRSARRGAVAYDEDGSHITSRADLLKPLKSA